MKKLLSLLTVAALLLCVLSSAAFASGPAFIGPGEKADGITSNNVQPNGGDSATIIDSNGNIISSGNGSSAYTGGKVVVTKNPTGEKVEKGGSATFTAYASSGAAPVWRLVSSDTLETIYAAGAGEYFNDVVVTGAYSNRLTLQNIPESMNKWQVEAMFDDGFGGYVFTAGAQITVVGSTANGTTTDKNPNGRAVAVGGNGNVPSINGQPTGATLTSGKSTTLSVTAGTNDGGKLRYQWYVAGNAELTDAQAIAGATSASYTPGELPGTRYYYCAVWSEKDGVKSETVNSEAVAVTYPETPTPTPTPSPTPTPATNNTANAGTSGNTATNNTTSNTNTNTGSATTTNTGTASSGSNQTIVPAPSDAGNEPSPTPEAQTTKGTTTSQVDTETRSSLPVILGAIAAVALAAGVGLLVLRRNAGQ